jgi:hypothetical protein
LAPAAGAAAAELCYHCQYKRFWASQIKLTSAPAGGLESAIVVQTLPFVFFNKVGRFGNRVSDTINRSSTHRQSARCLLATSVPLGEIFLLRITNILVPGVGTKIFRAVITCGYTDSPFFLSAFFLNFVMQYVINKFSS